MNNLDSFVWGQAPLREFVVPAAVALVYAVVCAAHRAYFGNSPPVLSVWEYVKFLLPYHNLFLAVISLIMFVGCLFSVFIKVMSTGRADWLICEDVGVADSGSLEFWSYMYYLSKFYELLDTVFQLIRGRYPPHYLLHSYHHSGVLIMCWAWLQYRPSLRFLGLMFNVFVHIPMYYYFYLKSKNIDPWWKKYVTKLQIVQFMTSIALFAWTVYLVLVEKRECNNMQVLYIQLFFNVSLLAGFIGVLSSPGPKLQSAKKQS